MTRPTRHESTEHEEAAGKLLRVIESALAGEFGRRMGVGIFVFDLGESGYLGWASNCRRADTATTLVEWLGSNEPEILSQAVERWRAQGILGPGAERTN